VFRLDYCFVRPLYKTSGRYSVMTCQHTVQSLTFRGPYIVIYSYNKTKEMHQFPKFIFEIELYMFWTGFLSIIKSLALYTQQYVYVIQVMLTDC
jgi:hypothetical protein